MGIDVQLVKENYGDTIPRPPDNDLAIDIMERCVMSGEGHALGWWSKTEFIKLVNELADDYPTLKSEILEWLADILERCKTRDEIMLWFY